MLKNNLKKLENTINYTFNDKKNLYLALIHPSYANEHKLKKYETNQRLEFLGDAILEFITSSYLYELYNDKPEGFLTKKRSELVCADALSKIAKNIGLYNFLLIGKGEDREKIKDNVNILCDTLEAIIGSIYIDSNIENAKKFIYNYILTEENINNNIYDYKTIIQELANENNVKIEYILVNEIGPDHQKIFFTDIFYDKKNMGHGIGHSKKESEQDAARIALKELNWE